MRRGLTFSVLYVLTLCVVILAVSMSFLDRARAAGAVMLGLSVLCVAATRLLGIRTRTLGPDIIFGVVDNGVLVLMAVYGGRLAGITGAIIGGAVGNAVTDGIAGIFEGAWAEHTNIRERTVLGSAIGKMAGCLLGSGLALLAAS